MKNLDTQVRGFAAFEKESLCPARIMEKFGDMGQIIEEDPDILNYENAQVLLFDARNKDVQEEIGIDLNEERETADTAEFFNKLQPRKEKVSLKSLLKGEFPSKTELLLQEEICLPLVDVDDCKKKKKKILPKTINAMSHFFR